MDNIINKIIEIDDEACRRVEDAEEKKKQIISQAKIEAAGIKEEHKKRADEKLIKVEECEKSVADEKIAKIENEKQEKIKALQKIFDDNHLAWEQEIFKRIVGE
ncbi:MAG: hypothetical protein N2Z57_08950 [Oscillospiraceae bacterium]|nr:hypothetical protein [Oscillospiraceae bacterium]